MALSKKTRKFLTSENSLLKYESEDDNARIWIRDINKEQETYDEYRSLFKKLQLYPDTFSEYYRMSSSTFDIILNSVKNK